MDRNRREDRWIPRIARESCKRLVLRIGGENREKNKKTHHTTMVQDSLTAAVILKAVLISFGRRGKRHHALILERTKFRTVSDLRSGTDGVIRVEEIDASSGGGADAATSAAITIITAIIIVSSLVSVGVQVIDNCPRIF